MKFYTSRYSNPELNSGNYTVVGITRGQPKFPLGYTLAGNIIEFAPPFYLFDENDRSVFTPKYFRNMDRLGIEKVKALIRPYAVRGKDIVFCCYEDVRIQGEWCHRLVFAEWWKSKTGEEIPELPDPTVPKSARHTTEEPDVVQLSLFDSFRS